MTATNGRHLWSYVTQIYRSGLQSRDGDSVVFDVMTRNPRGRRGRHSMVVGFTTTYAISSITTNVVSSNPTQAIQHHVIKFVSDIRQVGGFLRYSGFLHDITKILLKVTLSIINLSQLETLGSVTFL